MIAAVYGPCGIVMATLTEELLMEEHENDAGVVTRMPVRIPGATHVIDLWGRYAVMFNNVNQNALDNRIIYLVEELKLRWNEAPRLEEFMPYLKKALIDYHIQMIGVVAGYDIAKEGNGYEPFVYQVLGTDMRRVNVNEQGQPTHNYICMEPKPLVSRLIRECKLSNGDEWEECDHLHVRCDLFSNEKSIDFCKFLLHTNHYAANLHSVMYSDKLCYEIAVMKPGPFAPEYRNQ